MATNDMRCVDSDIRILLVGKTGQGKSSTANSIIGANKFNISGAAKSSTRTTQWSGICTRFGKTIEVIDTPGLMDTHQTELETHRELMRSVLFATPGFHAIAFVLEKGRFTEELVKTKNLFFEWFGTGVEKYACIILTRAEDEKSVNEYISTDTTKDLDDLVRKCNGRQRIAPIENTSIDEKRKETQVKRIIEMVEEIKRTNNNTHFTNFVFQVSKRFASCRLSKEMYADTIFHLKNTLTYKNRKMLESILEKNNETNYDQKGFDVEDNQTSVYYGDTEKDPLYMLKSEIQNGREEYRSLYSSSYSLQIEKNDKKHHGHISPDISSDTTEDLDDLVRKCGGRTRIAPIENKSADVKRKEDQVKRIIEMVEEIKRTNNNTHFTNVAFQLATAYAYNRLSEVISMETIYILRKAGLQVSDKACKMLDNILEVHETDDSASGSSTFSEEKKTNRRENRNIDINSVRVTYSSDKGFNDYISKDDPDDQTREDSGPSREDSGTSRGDSGTSDTDPLDEL